MNVMLKKVNHDYFGTSHEAIDFKQMSNIFSELVEKGIVVRNVLDDDFLVSYDILTDDPWIEPTIWCFQDTTGIQRYFNLDLFKKVCKLGGIEVEIKEMK